MFDESTSSMGAAQTVRLPANIWALFSSIFLINNSELWMYYILCGGGGVDDR